MTGVPRLSTRVSEEAWVEYGLCSVMPAVKVVGAAVGATVGDQVGAGVGLAVGAVGAELGASEGRAVGACPPWSVHAGTALCQRHELRCMLPCLGTHCLLLRHRVKHCRADPVMS